MKILVFSDTHGRINTTINLIKAQNPDMIIHLGDLVKDAEDLNSVFNDIRFEYVAGNNDFYSNVPYEKIINIDNKKIFITHGHKYRVKYGLDDIISKGETEKVDCILFGHTHEGFERMENNILLLNPGSISIPRNNPSYGLIEIKNNEIYSMLCELK